MTTFTKKAANEMKERIAHMLKGTTTELHKLKIGTFHGICSRILSQYGRAIGVDRVRVAADRDWNDIMKPIINPIADEIREIRKMISTGAMKPGKSVSIEGNGKSSSENPYDLKKVKKQISKLKSKGMYPEDYFQQKDHNKELHMIFKLFQNKLEENGLLDFDDLLVKTNLLLSKVDCLKNIQHVLIDEFQDTNTIQLELMTRFAKGTPGNGENISIVGDPDQSIYRFRDAVAMNFEHMRANYPECRIINLEENYRSTSDVLNFSEQLMRQQRKRLSKTLNSQFDYSFPVVYQTFDKREEEAISIAEEIKHLMSLPGLFEYSSFSILIRAAYQSRVIESALNRNKVPYIIVKGRAFWERKEIETSLDFMRIVAFEDDKPALLRTLIGSTTGIGPVLCKKIESIIDEERAKNKSALSTIESISNGNIEISPKIKVQIQKYFSLIQQARSYIVNKNHTKESLLLMFDYLISQEPLKTLNTEEERAQNIEELKNQLRSFDPEDADSVSFDEDGSSKEFELSLLESFLVSIELQSNSDNKTDNRGSVCVSTIHSSKGLEWPVVFIPGLTEGSLPASFASKDEEQDEAFDEERRIFYVSATRAKQLLYITSAAEESIWLNEKASPSRFLTKEVKSLMSDRQLALTSLKSVQKLYASMGVDFVKDNHQAITLDTITKYEQMYQERERQRLAMEEPDPFDYAFMVPRINLPKFLAGTNMDTTKKTKPNPQMGEPLTRIKSKPLPGPGFKSFAPGSKKLKSEINIKRDTPLAGQSNRARSDTNGAKFKFSRVGGVSTESKNIKCELPPPVGQFKTAPRNSSIKRESSTNQTIPHPVKKKKTLGVRRRMPKN